MNNFLFTCDKFANDEGWFSDKFLDFVGFGFVNDDAHVEDAVHSDDKNSQRKSE